MQAARARWPSKAGAWFGLGASPGSLLLGAELAARHAGPVPLGTLLAGIALMAALLWAQGQLGLAPPLGEGEPLTHLSRRYVSSLLHRVLGLLLAGGMVGWYGFNVGLGGAALSALLDLPGPAGPLLLGLPVLAVALNGLRGWNALSTAATAAALALVAVVVAELAAPAAPVTLTTGPARSLLADIGLFVGFVSVFSVRAPDFTAGLAGRGDLAWCVLLLCLPLAVVVLAGAGLHLGTGSSDVVALLASPQGAAYGNLLIAAATVGPTFTTLVSGSLALDAVGRIRSRHAMLLITTLGLALAITRFDQRLAGWLTILAAVLPPVVVPLGVEAARRRRGRAARLIPLWSWAPGSAVAVAMTLLGLPAAPLAGLGTAGLATALWALTPERARWRGARTAAGRR